MKQLSLIILAVTLVIATSTAHAGGQSGSIGVGVEKQINDETGGASVNYDAGKFHFGGFFGYRDTNGRNNHTYSLGGRFFYHLHSTAMSDFGLGLGLGVASVRGPNADDPRTPDDRASHVFVEPSVQIRLFLASNVALSFTAGMSIGTLDANGELALDGQGFAGVGLPTGLAGIHYYFF